jgi:hypothetical protein
MAAPGDVEAVELSIHHLKSVTRTAAAAWVERSDGRSTGATGYRTRK